MRYYEDDGYNDDQNRRKKKLKHASNKPGQGMRILNIQVEEDIDVYDDFNYNNELDDETTLTYAKQR